VPLANQALEEYGRLQENLSLGKGELEAIAYCKTEKCTFATNDIKARGFAKREGVSVISLQAILKVLWKKKIKSKEEVKEILETIKDRDNLAVSRELEKEIFE
jgi:predicted nucleic acid-binding protein